MIKIGDFSKLSKLSIRVLRHYDEIDLLKPHYIDPATGYRFYEVSQLKTTEYIKVLKEIGLSLTAIQETLGSLDEATPLSAYLSAQRDVLHQTLDDTQNRILLLDSMLEQLKGDQKMPKFTVNTKIIPARTVMSVRDIIPSFDAEGILWDRMMSEAKHPVSYANPAYVIAKFHDNEYKEQDVDVEIQMSVTEKGEDTTHIRYYEAPSELIASVILEGSYDSMSEVVTTIAQWIDQNGYTLNGPMFNIYLVGPGQEPDPTKWITEVCYPITK